MSGRLRQKRQRRMLGQVGGLSLGLLLAVGIGAYFAARSREPKDFNFAGITCKEVQRLAPQYMAGTLAAERADQIKRHLEMCPRCRQLLEQMGGSMAAVDAECHDPACHFHRTLAASPNPVLPRSSLAWARHAASADSLRTIQPALGD